MKKTCLTFLLFFSAFSIYAQEIPERETLLNGDEDEIIDDLLGEDNDIELFLKSIASFQFLYFSVDYNNKTYFSGRDIETDQFNINPQITYIHSNGFFAGITGVYYSEFTPRWDYTSLSVGYGKNFGKDKTYKWTTSYAKYFYSQGVDNPFSNAISASIEINNKKKTYGTELSSTYLFGGDNSLQITSTSYGIISLFKTKKTHLKFRPELNIVIGQQVIQFAQTFTVRGRQFTRYIQNNDFGLINTQLQIPLQLNSNDFDFELGYIVNFPSALEGESNLKTTGSIHFSISYLLDL